jgi:hypothetical protein
MKQLIYSFKQRVLHSKHEEQLILPFGENQQLSFSDIISSFDFFSTPSQQMRMCYCCMSC